MLNEPKTVGSKKAFRKPAKFKSLWSIDPETFTSLIEFVKNYLVKIDSPCHYQTPYPLYQDGQKF